MFTAKNNLYKGTLLWLCHNFVTFCYYSCALCLWVHGIFVCNSYLCDQIHYFFQFRKLPQHFEILVGTPKLSSGGTRYKANATIIHDFYYKETLDYDIALVRSQMPIQFNDYVQPITYSKKEVTPNTELLASGWGKWSTVSKFCEKSRILHRC